MPIETNSNLQNPLEQTHHVRLMLQRMTDLGLHESAKALELESNTQLEPTIVKDFRQNVIQGNWPFAEQTVKQLKVTVGSEDVLPI
jgi:hypothetical protein